MGGGGDLGDLVGERARLRVILGLARPFQAPRQIRQLQRPHAARRAHQIMRLPLQTGEIAALGQGDDRLHPRHRALQPRRDKGAERRGRHDPRQPLQRAPPPAPPPPPPPPPHPPPPPPP